MRLPYAATSVPAVFLALLYLARHNSEFQNNVVVEPVETTTFTVNGHFDWLNDRFFYFSLLSRLFLLSDLIFYIEWNRPFPLPVVFCNLLVDKISSQ